MSANTNNSESVANHFNAHWDRYLQVVKNNALFHKEMFSTLDTFLQKNINKPFTLADMGCGDCSMILPILMNKPIQRYIAMDATVSLIEKARANTIELDCEKEFICEDMRTGINKLTKPIDIIFSSYAVHHLSYDNKVHFLQQCQNKLENNGYFILVDGVLAINQKRDAWIIELGKRLRAAHPEMTDEEADELLDHPRKDDFPESIATFETIAQRQKWKNVEVLVDKDIFAFMVFSKG